MQDIMHDLETLGNSAGCAILSIGAIAFDPETGELGEEFYTVVNASSCVVAGLRYDQDTLDWWGKQSPEAREVLKQAFAPNSPSLRDALNSFSRYIHKACGGKNARLWGNGADFDNPILATAYKAAGIAAPWKFWDSRCYRTLKNLHAEVPLQKRTGTHHNALDDAKTQAEHALQIFAARRKAADRASALEDEKFFEPLAFEAKTAVDPGALATLRVHQRQLDADGVEVGVSRQALEHLLAQFSEQLPMLMPGEQMVFAAAEPEDDLIG